MSPTDSPPPAENFPSQPPFPNASEIPTAPLLRLHLQRLLDVDPAERQRLWDVCCALGFFYLDLRGAQGVCPGGSAADGGSGVNGTTNGTMNGTTNGTMNGTTSSNISGDAFLATAADLFTAAEELFALPVAEKQQYDFAAKGSYFGYKGMGAAVTDAAGTKDRNEFYNVSKDDILGQAERLPAPSVLEPHRSTLKEFMTTSHAIVRVILGQLETALELPRGTLSQMHRLEAISGDQVRWVRSPPQPAQDQKTALGAHTDFGSVTLLFNRLGGLQILPPGHTLDDAAPDDWQYVRPLPGHCIVNLGDAMVKFTRGILRSNIHRVVNPPGEQANSIRTSLVYFARPEDGVVLQPIRGNAVIDARKDPAVNSDDEEKLSSKDWILRRALGGRIGIGGKDGWKNARGTEAMSARTEATAVAN